jgi:hypothetical protein
LFDFAGVANFLGVSHFRVSSQKTQPLILKNPRLFDFSGVANFLGVSRFWGIEPKNSTTRFGKKIKKKSQLAETVAAPCQN